MRRPIRRFDIFAEYHKDEALRDGRPLAEAKGYGLWLAKVVAGRRYGASAAPAGTGAPRPGAPADEEPSPFRSVGGVPQTDALFDREIVDRMGEGFYRAVFAPAVERAFREGKSYEAIRDALRKDWKP
jgi:hypothetical protein